MFGAHGDDGSADAPAAPRPGSRWARRLLRVGLVLGVLAIGGVVITDVFVRQMVYPAPGIPVPSPPPLPLVEVPLEHDGESVSAWWLPPGRPGAPVLLMLHGNGENLETMRRSGLFDAFAGRGAGVLAIDYPGYGRSGGSPSEAANVAAAWTAWGWLTAHAEGRPRVVAGWSLGAAVATQVAAAAGDARAAGDDAKAADGLLLLSPWDRLEEVARLHFPAWMVSAFLPERYDSLAAAARVRCPSLVVHGEIDELIPLPLGARLHAALPEPKGWLAIPGAGHNDLLDRREVWQAIGDFLAGRERPPAAVTDPG